MDGFMGFTDALKLSTDFRKNVHFSEVIGESYHIFKGICYPLKVKNYWSLYSMIQFSY